MAQLRQLEVAEQLGRKCASEVGGGLIRLRKHDLEQGVVVVCRHRLRLAWRAGPATRHFRPHPDYGSRTTDVRSSIRELGLWPRRFDMTATTRSSSG